MDLMIASLKVTNIFLYNYHNSERTSVSYTKSTSYDDFIIDACARFEYNHDEFNPCLYYVARNGLWKNRIKINSDQSFHDTIREYLSLGLTDRGRIYFHCTNESPQNKLIQITPPILKNGDSSSKDSSSSKSSNKEMFNKDDQKRFRSNLIIRDGEKCRVCKVERSVEAAHIIDFGVRIKNEDLMKIYKLNDIHDYNNGLIMCSNCHKDFDNFNIGIMPNGIIIPRNGNANNLNPSESIMNSLDEDVPLIMQGCLQWKYQRFIEAQGKQPESFFFFEKIGRALSLTPEKK